MTSAALIKSSDSSGRPHHVEGIGHFRPRARLLKSLGEELISSETVAVLELVRNCYDADATRVELRFSHPADPTLATLEIRDNGHGMTAEVLLGPWLEPATAHKAAAGADASTGGETSPGGRRRLGSKGVGRFATQRLGRELLLLTRPEGYEYELEARFDWSRLEHGEHFLDQLEIPWKRLPVSRFKGSGTRLCLTSLRDVWSDERFERLRIGLARLVSPVLAGQTLEIVLIINGQQERIRPVIDRQQAMFSLEGDIGPQGLCRLVYRDLHGVAETWERTVTWPTGGLPCGPFQFRIHAWDLDRDALEPFLARASVPVKPREFKRLLREHAGISLYRDGFRILPYGEPDNDWLRLDRRRVNNPTLRFSNNQLLGWLQLSAEQNPGLKDQTNREGLVDNAAYRHLQAVVLELLSMLEARRAVARRSGIAQERRALPLPELGSRTQREIGQLLDGLEQGGPARRNISQLRDLISSQNQAVAGAVQQYAGLATSGVLSAQLFQQLQHPLLKLKHELTMVQHDLESGDVSLVEDCARGIVEALKQVETLQLRLQKADPFVSARAARKLQRLNLRLLVQEVLTLYEDRLAALTVDLDWRDETGAEWVTRGEVLQQALAHILDNAVYWLEQAKTGHRVLRISLEPELLRLENSGPPLDKTLLSRIFDPYFSQKPNGAGLGLTITRDLLATLGLEIHVHNTPLGVAFDIAPRG